MKCCSVYRFSKNGTNCKELTFVVDAALVSSDEDFLMRARVQSFG
jgi:hypothetical protein